MQARRARLALIGLDAVDLGAVERWRNDLPTLRRALDQGHRSSLRSSADVLPASIWPTFLTGSTPGDHGIYFPLQWDPPTMRFRPAPNAALEAEPFWRALVRRGRRVLAIDVPMTSPAALDGSVELTSWGSHELLDRMAAHPASLVSEVRRRFGRHPMGVDVPASASPASLRRMRDHLVCGAERKGELVDWLLRTVEWDFAIAVFGEAHRGGHVLWATDPTPPRDAPPSGVLRDVYRAIDRALGRVLGTLERAGADVLLFALHGMGANDSQDHFTSRLVERILGSLRRDAPGARAMAKPFHGVRFLRERVPGPLQAAVARLVPRTIRDRVVARATTGGCDWAETPMFALPSGLPGFLRVNLRGRERDGSMDADGGATERLLDYVERVVRGLEVAESGGALVRDVVRAQEAFPGRRSHLLPDLVIRWEGAPSARRVVSDHLGVIEAEPRTGRSGNHRPDAFSVFLPAAGSSGFGALPADIRDLAPLVHASFA